MLLTDLIKNAPYRTPLTDSNNIMSKQWVNWFTKAFQAILENLVIDISDLNTIVSIDSNFNANISNELNALNINNIEQSSANLDQILDIINVLLSNQANPNCNQKEYIEPVSISNNQESLSEIELYQIDNSQQIQDLSNNVGILSTTQPISNVNVDILLDNTYYRVLVDSSSSAVTITLPDCTTCVGKEYIIYGFEHTNTITVDTTSSQQIKRISTDTAITDIINSGDVVTYVSQGAYWVANN